MTRPAVVGVHPNDGSSPWAEPDAAWFRQNPNQTRMFRPLIRGEFGGVIDESLVDLVEVTEVRPGVRARRPVLFEGGAA